MGAPDAGFFRFSSDALPERGREAMFREAIAREYLRIDVESLGEATFSYDLTIRTLPGLRLASSVLASPLFTTRSRELASDGNDDVLLVMGASAAAHRSLEIELDPGDAVPILGEAVPMTVRLPSGRTVGLALNRGRLAAMVPGFEDAAMQPIPRGCAPLRLLNSYVASLEGEQTLAMPELRHLVVSHVYDLVALSIGASRDVAAEAAGRGVRAARLRAIKLDIAAHLGSRGLTIGALAARHAISTIYVQKLFEAEGTNFSEFVRNQRLGLAHRRITDPRNAARNISAIAFECGFGDLSYFNRAFRRRYGATPSQIRATAREEE
jgi:AraC-like DNA-binding protein